MKSRIVVVSALGTGIVAAILWHTFASRSEPNDVRPAKPAPLVEQHPASSGDPKTVSPAGTGDKDAVPLTPALVERVARTLFVGGKIRMKSALSLGIPPNAVESLSREVKNRWTQLGDTQFQSIHAAPIKDQRIRVPAVSAATIKQSLEALPPAAMPASPSGRQLLEAAILFNAEKEFGVELELYAYQSSSGEMIYDCRYLREAPPPNQTILEMASDFVRHIVYSPETWANSRFARSIKPLPAN